MLSDAKGHTRSVVRLVEGETYADALAATVAEALAALNRPALVKVVCNHTQTCKRLKRLDAGAHQLVIRYRRGDAMGELGKKAYTAAERYLARRRAAAL